jgi:hypothetical protein
MELFKASADLIRSILSLWLLIRVYRIWITDQQVTATWMRNTLMLIAAAAV